MSPPDYAEFALAAEQRRAIYEALIRPQYLDCSARGLARPVAVITGGQPGSGKSALRRNAEQALAPQGGAALSDPDELRRFHPRFMEFNALDDMSTASMTQADASAWARQLLADAIAERRNIILDRTLGSPGQLAQMADALQAAGYDIRIEAMAVRSEVSAVRIFYRYEHERALYGYGRFTPPAFHDQAYAGLPDTLARAQQAGLAGSISLYDESARDALAAQTRQVVGMRAGRAHTGEELKELQGLESAVRRIASAQGYALGESARPTPYARGKGLSPGNTPDLLAAVKHATMPAEVKPAEPTKSRAR
ncbi:zeta toxin family protein [Diaphorobacter sp. JS3051]|uniref:zeta toxin family protein n=1 Tax=Diaphorobacter sp. JS3051 TaxID=2792224 RepID=UPI0018CAFD16|nr:zeta toxin family protein [Diaphorobacter sp. JS3051]QPN33412.1 zeta toxin family protein [Diaphorobacter sp. JS3051]